MPNSSNREQDNAHWLNLAISNDARINVLEDRFERHSDRWDAQIDKILKEIDGLKNEYYKERDGFINRLNKAYNAIIGTLIAVILAMISVFWQIFWEYFVNKK